MKKLHTLFLALVMMMLFTSCAQEVKPQISEMKAICELATVECYYHNVAKYEEQDAEGMLFWKKDKHFWIEYSGKVKIGIDMSLVDFEVKRNKVIITIPDAKVLSSNVDESTLTEDSFVIAKNSASIDADDQTKAYKEAQDNMVKSASEDATLLGNAKQRAQRLLEEYVEEIGEAAGKEYSIQWEYLESAAK